MYKTFLSSILLASSALALWPTDSVTAQNDAPAASNSALHLGKVDFKFQKPFHYTPTGGQFAGKVKMTSENYDLSCETLTFVMDQPKSKAKSSGFGGAVRKVTAEGDSSAGTQVIADIRRPLESQAFHIVADLAVYTPDPTRPGGVTLKFTGHVVITTASGFLAEPSVTTTDYATLRLGTGEDYPQLETGPGHVTVTPAQ